MKVKFRRALLPLVALVALLGCKTRDSNPTVVVSEFLASNGGTLTDADGDTSDWIEIENRGEVPVDLLDWSLSDDPRNKRRWLFPAVELPPRGYLVVFASGKNLTTDQLHTNFKLKVGEDYLGLFHPNGVIANEYAPYPEQRGDVSYGITRDGKPSYLARPTPGAPNTEALPSPSASERREAPDD